MLDFAYALTTELVVGRDAHFKVADYVKKYGGHRVLLHYGAGYIAKSGLPEQIRDMLEREGLTVYMLGGVQPNPRLSLVYEGIALCRRQQVDFLLAIGGGSTIDSAKAIGLGLASDHDVWDFFAEEGSVARAVPQASVPLGVVLTIAAAGSEASNSCVITNESTQQKRFCDHDVNRPKFAIENPLFTTTLPWFQTACGIVDIMAHSFERYFTPHTSGNQLTDRLCEAVFSGCMDCAYKLMSDPQDYEARANLMVASSISHCGITGIGRTGDWASHFIEHELSGEFDIAHGAGLAMIIPAWMKYVYPYNQDMFLKWATRVMGVHQQFDDPGLTIREGIARLEAFFIELGMPVRMSQMKELPQKLDDALLWKMARRVRAVNDDGSVGQVKHLLAEDVVQILMLAM